MISENELTPDQKYKMEQVLFGMKKNKRNFVKKYGMKAEALMKKRALKIAKQYTPEPTVEEMEDNRLKKLVQDVLSKPLDEKKAKPDFLDLDKDGDRKESMKKAAQDKKKMQMEDLDLGHEDDEPHMIKGELYKIAQNALALYKMLEPFDKMDQEVDLPAWWQSKVTKACTMLGSAKNYLEFELKEPQIGLTVNSISQEDAIDEGKLTKKEEKIVKALKKTGDFKKDDPAMYAIAKSKAKKLAEVILQRLKDKK